MNIKTTSKIWFLLLTISFILNSCIFDMKSAYGIRNCTNDTLLIDLTESSNLDSCWMYWGKHFEDTTGIQPDDTTVVYVHGEKVILSNYCRTQPDSVLFVDPHIFNLKQHLFFGSPANINICIFIFYRPCKQPFSRIH